MFRRGGKLSILANKDDRVKIINERINLTEKHFSEFCNAFRNIAQRLAKQRDTYDELAKCCKAYSDDEDINESLQEGLRSYANAITILGDYLDIKVHRLETKLVNDLSQYENVTKNVRDSLRSAIGARDKEVLKQRQMLDIKTKFVANNSGADSELLKAKLEVNRTNKEIDELSMNFEQRKLQNIKSILNDFILISMKYHTKALEVLSATYYDVSNIDEKSDLQEFNSVLRIKQEQSNKHSTLKHNLRSQSMDNLDTPPLLSPLQRTAKISKSRPNLTSDNSDDEPDEEDDDETAEDEEDTDEQTEDDDDESQTSSGTELSENVALPIKNHFKAANKSKEPVKATNKLSKKKSTFKTTKPVR